MIARVLHTRRASHGVQFWHNTKSITGLSILASSEAYQTLFSQYTPYHTRFGQHRKE